MGLFNKNGGIINAIRCDEPSYLIWKWHPAGFKIGENKRENSIRCGSPLRVKDGEVAVFVYTKENGIMQDFIVGPYDDVIITENFPVLSSIIGTLFGGDTPFQAEVYFINLAKIVQTKFAVPFFDVYDPRFADFSVPVAARGTISFKIEDYREFIKLHRLVDFSVDDFQKQIRDAVCRYVKDIVANAPAASNIPVVQIESRIAQINDAVEYDIRSRLAEQFGVSVSSVDISAIEVDKSSDGYSELMKVTRELSAETAKAQAAVNIKNMQDKQRIDAENYEETLRIQREEGQYAQHKQTQSANFAAYQIEKQAEVGVAGASALGQMGSNGAGGISLDGSGAGFNPAAMMASMAVGGVVGQNIAGTMSGVISGINQPNTGMVPPPIPANTYYVAVNGQSTGPFDISALKQMASTEKLTRTTLVWKQGMENWAQADCVEELKTLFEEVPPILPVE